MANCSSTSHPDRHVTGHDLGNETAYINDDCDDGTCDGSACCRRRMWCAEGNDLDIKERWWQHHESLTPF